MRKKQLESQGLLTTFQGEPTKGRKERTAGSWLAAGGHLEKEAAGLEQETVSFGLSSTDPSFRRHKIVPINQETNTIRKEVRKEKIKSNLLYILQFWKMSSVYSPF